MIPWEAMKSVGFPQPTGERARAGLPYRTVWAVLPNGVVPPVQQCCAWNVEKDHKLSADHWRLKEVSWHAHRSEVDDFCEAVCQGKVGDASFRRLLLTVMPPRGLVLLARRVSWWQGRQGSSFWLEGSAGGFPLGSGMSTLGTCGTPGRHPEWRSRGRHLVQWRVWTFQTIRKAACRSV